MSGRDQEDVATLLTSSWRKMRSLVLQKRNVQEFQFRQYLFAAQVGSKTLTLEYRFTWVVACMVFILLGWGLQATVLGSGTGRIALNLLCLHTVRL